MSFVEEVLDLGWDYGAQGGPEFLVTTIQTGGGSDKSNLEWSQPKGQWQIGDRTGDRLLNRAEYDYLYNFWMARRGPFEGFRYKDWGDFELIDEVIAIGDGLKTSFQITKRYGSFLRILKKIGDLSWQVGASQPAGAISKNTGILTLTQPLPLGAELCVNGEFHVPVKFIESQWPGRFEEADAHSGERYYELASLQLRGIRI
jgi:uncharacterized protein (TIGR02217 family)